MAASLQPVVAMKTQTHRTHHRTESEKRPAARAASTDWHDVPISAVMTPQPHTIGRDQTLATAHRMMRENGIRHLPVLEHGDIVGIVTQRDLYFIETIRGVDVDEDVVSDAMTQDSYVVDPELSVAEVARTMSERKLGCAVVKERDRVAGIFTATDALRLIGG
jgi:CBS domain-containing protein